MVPFSNGVCTISTQERHTAFAKMNNDSWNDIAPYFYPFNMIMKWYLCSSTPSEYCLNNTQNNMHSTKRSTAGYNANFLLLHKQISKGETYEKDIVGHWGFPQQGLNITTSLLLNKQKPRRENTRKIRHTLSMIFTVSFNKTLVQPNKP